LGSRIWTLKDRVERFGGASGDERLFPRASRQWPAPAAGLLGLPTERIKVQRNSPEASVDIEIILGTDTPELN
jgi:hypothetical protein